MQGGKKGQIAIKLCEKWEKIGKKLENSQKIATLFRELIFLKYLTFYWSCVLFYFAMTLDWGFSCFQAIFINILRSKAWNNSLYRYLEKTKLLSLCCFSDLASDAWVWSSLNQKNDTVILSKIQLNVNFFDTFWSLSKINRDS